MSNHPPIIPPVLPASWLACFREELQQGCYASYVVIRAIADPNNPDKFQVHSACWQSDGAEENHRWSYHHGDYVATWAEAIKRFVDRTSINQITEHLGR